MSEKATKITGSAVSENTKEAIKESERIVNKVMKNDVSELDITYLASHKLAYNSRNMLVAIVQETQKLQDKAFQKFYKLQNELTEMYYTAPGMRFTPEFARKKRALERATIEVQALESYKREVMATYKTVKADEFGVSA